jgi:SagB-type dehydrogenase family enzyme
MSEDIAHRFMEASAFRAMGQTDQVGGLPQPPLTDGVVAGAITIDLPEPDSVPVKDISLTRAFLDRRSVRQYAKDPLTLGELSYLLWVTQGIQRVTPRPATLRAVPSAGSRHPFETYLLCNKVDGLKPGLYKYAALDHRLVQVDLSPGVVDRFTEAVCGQPVSIVKDNAVTFIWVAVAYRSVWRYGARAYRFMHLDAGHVCQNLYLAVEAIDSGCCAIGGYHDDVINHALGIDGRERFVIYAAAVGKVASGS